jgi:hypothetical protein
VNTFLSSFGDFNFQDRAINLGALNPVLAHLDAATVAKGAKWIA